MARKTKTENLRPYLEYQADRIEAVLAAHRAPGRVTGGTVGPRLIRFFLNPAPHTRFSAIRRLADDLALAMRISNLAVDRDDNGVVLSFANPDPSPVTLIDLLDEVHPIPAATATLGLTESGVPLLARLSAPDVAHILVCGTTGSGKSILLRTMAASLVLTNTSNVVRLLCIDPKGRTFRGIDQAPHLARPIITAPQEALEALHSLVRAMELRDHRGELPGEGQGVPRIIVFIDELADLMMVSGNAVTEALTRLAQRGREAGIHLVVATQHPSAAILGSVMRANFPLRLVGRVASARDAQVAAGRGGIQAHLLQGRGDFLAISGGDHPIRFQVAHMPEQEIRTQIATLMPSPRRRVPALTMDRH